MYLLTLSVVLSNIPLRLVHYLHQHIFNNNSSHRTLLSISVIAMKLMLTDQIFAKVPAMDGGETSAHIFVGQYSKITDIYKSKDNSRAEFLGAFKDRVRERRVPTKLTADDALMYRGWNVTKYLRDLVVSMWQCETKYQNQNPAEN